MREYIYAPVGENSNYASRSVSPKTRYELEWVVDDRRLHTFRTGSRFGPGKRPSSLLSVFTCDSRPSVFHRRISSPRHFSDPVKRSNRSLDVPLSSLCIRFCAIYMHRFDKSYRSPSTRSKNENNVDRK
jgi:hypothetical protein